MDCREFKNQFEDDLTLGEKAKKHLESCENCQTFQDEEKQLTQMIRSLPKIEVPKDFEFGFKSKIANSQLNKPLSPIWRTLRYALPLTAAVLIFGFVIVNSNLFTEDQQTPQIAEKNSIQQRETLTEKSLQEDQEPPSETVAENVEQVDNEKPIETIDKSNTIPVKQSPPEVVEIKPKAPINKESEDDEILSRDITPETNDTRVLDRTLSIEKPINPRGINPDKKIVNPRMSQNAKSFTAKEVLSQLGIITNNENGRLRVNAVRRNSAGESSGVKVGDIVTAIDGQKLSNKPLQKRSVKGEKLTIIRKGQKLQITIRN